MEQSLAKAIKIAFTAHEGQTDKSGMPYAGHIMRVMQAGCTIDEKIVGVLHDVVEDTEWTFEGLLEEGFPRHISNGIIRRWGKRMEYRLIVPTTLVSLTCRD